MRKTAAPLLALAWLAAIPGLRAEEASEAARGTWTREVHNALGGGLNPIALQDGLDTSWRRPLYDSAAPILSEAHLSFGLSEKLTPAYDRVGVWVELAPLSVLDVRAGIEPVAYFGTFKSLLYFPHYGVRFDDDTRWARRDEAAFGLAGRMYVSPTVKAKAGRLLALAGAEFEWWKAQKKGAYFYEPARDTLLRASGDAMMTSQVLLLLELKRRHARTLRLGPVYDLTWVYAARRNRKQDVGLAVAWALGARRLGLKEPMAFGKAVYYVEDPWREHQLGLQLGVGFGMGR